MNNLQYKCPKCGKIKRYKIKKWYDVAVTKQNQCSNCANAERMQKGFEKWVEKRQLENKANRKACEFMDMLNQDGFSFEHALNGGEVWIDTEYIDSFGKYHKGIFLDGWDNNYGIVLEWDEPRHNAEDIKIRDYDRQNAIFNYFKGTNILFVRYDESKKQLYAVSPENPYNRVMEKSLKDCLNHLTKWYENSIDIDSDGENMAKLMQELERMVDIVKMKKEILVTKSSVS